MSLTLLAVGDLHLGRSPTRLPAALQPRAGELGPAGAWQRIVDHAIATRAQLLVLAGDVVQQEDDFFEAYRELARGVERLLAANIRVLGVAGNHDVQVLPRLADQIPGFHLLGRGGVWEQVVIEAGQERLTLHGWSFPQRVVTASPMERFRAGTTGVSGAASREPGVHLGLLHCDLDQSDSRYAPVSTGELRAAGLDGWLLGHIHAPGTLSPDALLGYLGSAIGLDPGEPGARGPWCIRISGGRVVAVEQRTLAPLHWARLDVDLSGIDAPEDARDRLLDAVRVLDAGLERHTARPVAAGLRVTLSGRTRHYAGVQALFNREQLDELYAGDGGIHYFVEKLAYRMLPEIDLDTLAQRSDAPGLLARRLLLLDGAVDDAERGELIRRARKRLQARATQPHWGQPVASDRAAVLSDAAIAGWLKEAALAALAQMLSDSGDRA